MKNSLFILVIGLSILTGPGAFTQQTCPLNINFSLDNLTHWEAYTGNRGNDQNVPSVRFYYDSTQNSPYGTIGVSQISEYRLPSVTGIQVLTTPGRDLFGGFAEIPTINGYQYGYSILLGSTSITTGGYVRGVSYVISVPATPVGQPYTMTYAYALILENGRHGSNSQPDFSSTVTIPRTGALTDSVISCASPKYFLPTRGNNVNSNGEDQILDTARAMAEGFTLSDVPSPNLDAYTNTHLHDIWTKDWTEVTFDLSPFRGKKVILTFEADNCVPGAHFAYAYVAVRNVCSGLTISGPLVACTNTLATYTVPALTGANFNWTVPSGWTIQNDGDSIANSILVTPGPVGGMIIAGEQNSCANLKDTIQVTTTLPTLPGNVTNDSVVCAGFNSGTLTLKGYRGSILNWSSSTDGVTWTVIPDSAAVFNYQSLDSTTMYRASVQNGSLCSMDISSVATVTVDQKSKGGTMSPTVDNFCLNQTVGDMLSLTGSWGQVINWQSSQDNVIWQGFSPSRSDTSYSVTNISSTTYYRSIVKSGVCPADTSSVAAVKLFPVAYPKAEFDPADTSICYGSTAQLSALIQVGTDYTWANPESLQNPGSGLVNSSPFFLQSRAAPKETSDYVLSVQNKGCPNLLTDTFHIQVFPQIIVGVNQDTSVVVGEPLQLNAFSNDSAANNFTWSPAIDLNDAYIADPVGVYGPTVDKITYFVRATDAIGCYGENKVSVTVFKTPPDIFVPNAFTPGNKINNIFRPIAVGISTLKFFNVYNRWGQLIYTCAQTGRGWDGKIDGKLQDSGTFVWMVEGVDYTGKVIFKKGTVVLIR
jgi:gliding motility-associated-like protein